MQSARRLDRQIGGAIFGSDIDGYEAARIGYPDGLYAVLREQCGRCVPSVLEIGPGTGLATFDLLAALKPNRYVGVEADPALAAHLDGKLAGLDIVKAATIVACRFEDFQACAPVDLVCCAAAFHWLDPDVSFAKLKRILRPGGVLALWWNTYRQAGIGDPFADRVTPLLADMKLAPSEGEVGHYSLDTQLHRQAVCGAGFVEFEPHLFRRERVLSTQQVLQLFASYSYIRAMPEADRAAFLQELVKIADGEFDGRVPNVVLTALYLARSPSVPEGP